MILPRFSNGTPTASNSRLYQPDAMPMSSRPSESRSMLESCFASTTGLRSGSTRMPVPSLILLVRAAIAVSSVSESMIGKVRIDAEQDVIPDPERVEAELLHPDAVVDQRLGVRHFRIGGEVARGDAERVAADPVFKPCIVRNSDQAV